MHTTAQAGVTGRSPPQMRKRLCLKGFPGANPIEACGLPGIKATVCAASVFSPVYLHESGNLRHCSLAQDKVVVGRPLFYASMGTDGNLGRGRGGSDLVSEATLFLRVRNWARRLL